MAGRPQTPASPKNVKLNSPVAGTPMFGCGTVPPNRDSPDVPMLTQHTDHVQLVLTRNQETTNSCIQHYKSALRAIYDGPPMIAQTSKALAGSSVQTTLNSNYLCLQCSLVINEADIEAHGNQKSHRFCMLPRPFHLVAISADSLVQSSSPEPAHFTARCAKTLSGIRLSRSSEIEKSIPAPFLVCLFISLFLFVLQAFRSCAASSCLPCQLCRPFAVLCN